MRRGGEKEKLQKRLNQFGWKLHQQDNKRLTILYSHWWRSNKNELVVSKMREDKKGDKKGSKRWLRKNDAQDIQSFSATKECLLSIVRLWWPSLRLESFIIMIYSIHILDCSPIVYLRLLCVRLIITPLPLPLLSLDLLMHQTLTFWSSIWTIESISNCELFKIWEYGDQRRGERKEGEIRNAQ